MHPLARPAARTLLAGAAAGAVFLGAGGRFAMYVFAVATDRPPAFTFRGALSVVMAGTIAGTIGALVLVFGRRVMPQRVALRGLVFGLTCYVIAIPGFRPPTILVFSLFAPLFLAYGMATVWLTSSKWRSKPSTA